MSLDDVTELQDSTLFDSVQLPSRPDETDPWLVASVALEMDMNLRIIERNIFGVLDFLSDIGGLEAMFVSIVAIVISVWNWHGLTDIFLLTQLYDLPSMMKAAGSSPKAGCCKRRKMRLEARS